MDIFISIFKKVLEGGPEAIIALLLLMMIGCFFIIRYLVKSNKEKEEIIKKTEEKNEKIIEKYFQANLTMSEALKNVQIALIEIKSKL